MPFDDDFLEILEDFDTTMLVLASSRGDLWSCPLFLGRNKGQGTSKRTKRELWFLTAMEDEKLDDVKDNTPAVVTLQGPSQYMSIHGHISMMRDPSRTKELWRPVMYAWTDGKDDPNLVLIRLVPQRAHYWDDSSLENTTYTLSPAEGEAEIAPNADKARVDG